jgi:hypothetical protein
MGAEREFTVTVTGDPLKANRIGNLSLRHELPPPNRTQLQPTVLKVAHGVCAERSMFWPRDPAVTIYAPRYVAKYYYLNSCAAAFLLDPLGLRRHDTKGTVYPRLRLPQTDEKGQPAWKDSSPGTLLYWNPGLRKAEGDEPAAIVESGTHPHFPRGCGFEHRWTEEFIVVWYRWSAEKMQLDWSSDHGGAGEKFLFHTGGKVEGENYKGPAVRAVFRKVGQFAYGEATVYPPGSELSLKGGKKGAGVQVTCPANAPVAFTYCTEEEFPALVEKWLKNPLATRVRPRQQGSLE